MVDAALMPAPWFFTVSETAMTPPGPTASGAVSDDATRSGPMLTTRPTVLLNSLASASTPSASALAMTKYSPTVVSAGIVSDTTDARTAPGERAGTGCTPDNTTSVASITAFFDSQNLVVEGSEAPAPWFRVVTDASTVVAAPALAGTARAETTRSAGAFGVADASFESSLVPSPLLAATT